MARWTGNIGAAEIAGLGGSESHSAAQPGPLVATSSFPAVIDLATLNGDDGFRLNGSDFADLSGFSVSSVGDINGDGLDDIIVGARGGDSYAGESYVVFGKLGGFGASLDLAALDGTNGFRLDGVDPSDQSGFSVSSAGDFNGDGVDDILIGAPGSDPRAGQAGREAGSSYVVFGNADGFGASFDLSTLDGTNGFRLDGSGRGDFSGFSVASAGDVNGDGFDDIIIGADRANAVGNIDSGESYVVFGKAGGLPATFDLATLDGSNGFRLDGIDAYDLSGFSVASAGDVNGDGFDDIIIGASSADPGGDSDAGESYVVFGKEGGFTATLDLSALDGSNGFHLDGIDTYDSSGASVASAGDVNGDGFDDIIIGARYADPDGQTYAGESYVVFGQAGGFAASLDLSTLDGSNGFRINGIDAVDYSGFSVSGAGDVNGDGFDDIIIGATGADSYTGESYVVFGKASEFSANLDLGMLDGTNGFRIDGVDAFDRSGYSVSSAGDINGDGFGDIIVGAPYADPGGKGSAGESYVIFGRAPTEAVVRIGSAADQTISGGDFNDLLRGKQGDDMLIGNDGDDWLRGGDGADELVGGAGTDRMNGGDGHDSISGGAEADLFVIASAAAEDTDEFVDFASGEDQVVLGADTFPLDEGELAAGSFVIGDAAADADDRVIYNDTTGQLFFDVDGTGAQAQVLIATLTGAPVIAVQDFLVI